MVRKNRNHAEKTKDAGVLKQGNENQSLQGVAPSQEAVEMGDLYLRLSFLCHDLRTFQGNPGAQQRLESSVHPHHLGPPYLSEEEASNVLSLDLQALRHTQILSGHHSTVTDETSAHQSDLAKGTTLGQYLEEEMESLMSARRAKAEAQGNSTMSPDFVLCTSHDLAPILQTALGLQRQFNETKMFRNAYKRWEKGVKKLNKQPTGRLG